MGQSRIGMKGLKMALPKSKLKDGEYYYGACRNAHTARWDAHKNQFTYWRHKFGTKFLETIRHPEDDDGFDLFHPKEIVTWGTDYIPFED